MNGTRRPGRKEKKGHDIVVVGVCGGISAGKSTVAQEFGRLGALVLDADAMAHEALQEPAARKSIVCRWGMETLSDGEIDRSLLGAKAFGKREEMDELTAILHPRVLERINQAIRKAENEKTHPAVVLDAPLLFETGLDKVCRVLVFVKASREVRKKRASAQRGWPEEELVRREKFQKKVNFKEERADYIIDNNFSKLDTRRQVRRIWEKIFRN